MGGTILENSSGQEFTFFDSESLIQMHNRLPTMNSRKLMPNPEGAKGL